MTKLSLFRRGLGSRLGYLGAGLSLLWLAGLGAPARARGTKSHTYTIPLPPRPDFSPLAWLVGEWSGRTQGGSGGDVHLSVAYALDKRFLMLHEQVSMPATKSLPPSREVWTGFLGAARGGSGFTLHIFSSTGFVTQYHVTFDETRLRFIPEGGAQTPPGWLFRRILTRVGEATLTEDVQVAPPDGTFFDYYTARLRRAPSDQNSAADPRR
jgi:hypothetical protein